jgi:hypothetical protein
MFVEEMAGYDYNDLNHGDCNETGGLSVAD